MAIATAPVLIVGSGPSGLTLALAFRLSSVQVRIIERLPRHREGSRGTTLQPRTLEHLATLGILHEDLLREGTPPLQMRAYAPPDGTKPVKTWEWSELPSPDPRVPYPRPVTISQAVLEAMLRKKLKEMGTEVELGKELKGLDVEAAHVSVSIDASGPGGGANEVIKTGWVFLADGGKGISRDLLSVKFLGETRDAERMFVADVFAHGIDSEFWHMWGNFTTAAIGLKPLGPADLFQLQLIGPSVDFTSIKGDSDINSLFHEISGRRDITLRSVAWSSEYRAVMRLVDTMKVGRCFMLGDVAHCHSPAGGQGLNTSIHDAFNLGWKFALTYHQRASQDLLESFGAERMPVIAEMLALSTELHQRVFLKKQESGSAHDGGKAEDDPMFRPKHLQQLGVNYRFSDIVYDERQDVSTNGPGPYDAPVTRVVPGDRAPDAPELYGPINGTLFSCFDYATHTMLFFMGIDVHTGEELIDALSVIPADVYSLVIVLQKAQTSDSLTKFDRALHVVDTEKHAHRAYGVDDDETVMVAVRPDGFIGAFLLSGEGIRCYFDKVLGQPVQPRT